MNTCKLCGGAPTLPTHDVCEDCAYDLNKRLNDWIASPTLSHTERNNDDDLNRSRH